MSPTTVTVLAEVVDVRGDAPRAADVLFVDTNVWYWTTYTRASLDARPYQIQEYPAYIKRALKAGGRLLHCGLTLAELAHVIEDSEYQLFVAGGGTMSKKELRRSDPTARTGVVTEIKSAWSQVARLGHSLEFSIDNNLTQAGLKRIEVAPMDGYDVLVAEGLLKRGFTQVLTDDGDFASVPQLRVFTANRNVLNAAHAAGRLIRR